MSAPLPATLADAQREIERLTAGADPTPSVEYAEMTPGQLLHALNVADEPGRLHWAALFISHSRHVCDMFVRGFTTERFQQLLAELAAYRESSASASAELAGSEVTEEWCSFQGEHPDDGFRGHNDEYDARESAQRYRAPAGIARRTVTRMPWALAPFDPDDPFGDNAVGMTNAATDPPAGA